MRYRPDIIEQVRNETDIVQLISSYLPLKQKGSSFFGLCPFHHEHTPSFSVSPDKQLYYCFGCGAAGNVFSFLMQMEHCEFAEALQILAERANITLPAQEQTKEEREAESFKERLYLLHKVAGRFYYDVLQSEEGLAARKYLEERRVSLPIQRKFGLGFSPKGRSALLQHLKKEGFTKREMVESGLVMENDHGLYDRFYGRLMFPIFDIKGRIIGFGGRILDKGEPKYLNSPETMLFQKKKNLYGVHFAQKARKDTILLVEGYMDMISIYQAGFPFVVASLGTAFHQDHANLLKKVAKEVILLFDSDEAGEKAALRAIPILVGSGFQVKVLQVPMGKDPDQFIKEHGTAAFGRLLVDAKGYLAFEIDCIRKKYNLENLEHKVAFTKEAAALLAKLPSAIERDGYTKDIAAKTGIDTAAIQAEIAKIAREDQTAFEKEAEKKRLRLYQGKTQVEARKDAKGVQEAQSVLLTAALNYPHLCQRLQEVLPETDYLEEVYQQMAKALYEAADAGQKLYPAQLVNLFETPQMQEKAAAVFAKPVEYPDNKALEKAVNEALQLVKRTKLDVSASSAESVEELQRLILEKKQLEQFWLTLS